MCIFHQPCGGSHPYIVLPVAYNGIATQLCQRVVKVGDLLPALQLANSFIGTYPVAVIFFVKAHHVYIIIGKPVKAVNAFPGCSALQKEAMIRSCKYTSITICRNASNSISFELFKLCNLFKIGMYSYQPFF